MSVTCNSRGPITAPKQPEICLKQVFLCQISGHYKELRAKYPHPRPYPGLALPGSRGPNLSSCYARGPHQNPKTTRDTSKITVFRCVYAVLQMGRSVRWSIRWSIPHYNSETNSQELFSYQKKWIISSLLSSKRPLLSGSRGPYITTCNAKGPYQNPKTTRDTSKITVFRCVYAVL